MPEFSPDTIQFEASADAPTVPQEIRVLQSVLYEALNDWLSRAQDPIWQQWLHLQIQEEALRCFLRTVQLPLDLRTLPEQLRALHAQITPVISHADTLRQLLHHWQKQTEALTLKNKAAYEKTGTERQSLNSQLADTAWPAAFLQQCDKIETFLAQQAEARFALLGSTPASPPSSSPLAPPRESTPLKQTPSGFILPSKLNASIFQRSSRAWVRRAARYLHIAGQDNFSNKKVLKKLLKSLYAALEQEPNNAPALLLLGWIFGCMGNGVAAMACLDRLHQHESHPEMIFLIRFLQNRPVL